MLANTVTFASEQIYENCKSIGFPWSVITSSTPNASLAAVLAGFMMTAVTFLLRERGNGKLATFETHTAALFGSGVLVLGLDAYLFGNIVASAPMVINSDHSIQAGMTYPCAIAWTQAMPASSMLAAGACSMLAGLAWVLANHFADNPRLSGFLLYLPGILIWTVLSTSSLLLVRTSAVYLVFMNNQFERDSADLLRPLSWHIWEAFVVLITCIIAFKARTLKIRQNRRLELNPNHKALAAASIFTALLAAVGIGFASFTAELIDFGWFVDERTHIPTLHSVYFAYALVVLPIWLIMLPIALAAPTGQARLDAGQENGQRQEQQERSEL
ncbi:MAG: hypothetical protein WB777_21845 [Mycobacterium sp.]